MDNFEFNIWRRATSDECRKIDEYVKEAYKHKIYKALEVGGYSELVIVFWSFMVGIITVEGDPKSLPVVHALIFFVIATAIDAGLCFLFLKVSKKRIKYIADQKIEVTDATVVDRQRIKNRSLESGVYATVKYGSEEKEEKTELRVIESVYEKLALGTEVLLVRYKEDTYTEGFVDTYDVVIK